MATLAEAQPVERKFNLTVTAGELSTVILALKLTAKIGAIGEGANLRGQVSHRQLTATQTLLKDIYV